MTRQQLTKHDAGTTINLKRQLCLAANLICNSFDPTIVLHRTHHVEKATGYLWLLEVLHAISWCLKVCSTLRCNETADVAIGPTCMQPSCTGREFPSEPHTLHHCRPRRTACCRTCLSLHVRTTSFSLPHTFAPRHAKKDAGGHSLNADAHVCMYGMSQCTGKSMHATDPICHYMCI